MPHTRPISKRMFWTIAALLGVAVAVAGFGLRYSAPSAEAAKISIDVGGNWFCSLGENPGCERTIDVGDTVSWQFLGFHTTTSDDGLWDSGTMTTGTFEFTFDSPGTFDYHCNVHPSSMQARIIVSGPAPTETPEPTPTPPDTPLPTATDVPAPTATETAVPTTTPTPDETPVLTPPPTPTATGTFVAPPTATITATPTTFGPPLTATPPPPGTVGDASNNGTVDSIDALLVLQFIAALLPDLPSEMNADANQNGTVDAIDATLILQFVADLIGILPP